MHPTRCKKKVSNTELLGKYSDDQARDDHGRWTSEGGGGGKSPTVNSDGFLPNPQQLADPKGWDKTPAPKPISPPGSSALVSPAPKPAAGRQMGGGVEPPVDWANYEHSSSDPNNPHLPFKNPDGSPAEPVSVGYKSGSDPVARESHLLNSPIAGEGDQDTLRNGISETRLLEFEDGSKAIFKPADGESGGARDNISDGYSTERETGAWQVAKIVGMDDMVAASVPREVDGQHGAMIEFQDGKVAAGVAGDKKFDGEEGLARAAAFDWVTGNEDRHSGNWIVNDKGDLKLIDHNLTFPDEGKIWSNWSNEEFIAKAQNKFTSGETTFTPKAMAKPYVANEAKIMNALKSTGLPQGSIDGVKERIKILSNADTWWKVGTGWDDEQ